MPLFELLDGGLEVTAHLSPRSLESFTVFGLVGLLGGLPLLEMDLWGQKNTINNLGRERRPNLQCGENEGVVFHSFLTFFAFPKVGVPF